MNRTASLHVWIDSHTELSPWISNEGSYISCNTTTGANPLLTFIIFQQSFTIYLNSRFWLVGCFEDLRRFSDLSVISQLEAGDNQSLKS